MGTTDTIPFVASTWTDNIVVLAPAPLVVLRIWLVTPPERAGLWIHMTLFYWLATPTEGAGLWIHMTLMGLAVGVERSPPALAQRGPLASGAAFVVLAPWPVARRMDPSHLGAGCLQGGRVLQALPVLTIV